MEEVWMPVVGYEGLYQVSNLGRVRSIDREVCVRGGVRTSKGQLIKPCFNGQGYLFVTLTKDNKPKASRINRLVAEAFIPNPENFPVVNHKDYDRTNNCADNLEWCTVEYNTRYSSAKKVLQYDLDGNFVAEWDAISDAARELKINVSNIAQCCMGNRKTAGKYVWKYKEAQ